MGCSLLKMCHQDKKEVQTLCNSKFKENVSKVKAELSEIKNSKLDMKVKSEALFY